MEKIKILRKTNNFLSRYENKNFLKQEDGGVGDENED